MTKKIVFVTDVCFWRRQTGAQQRIYALVTHLENSGHEITTCFVSSVDESDDNDDSSLIDECGLRVTSLIDDWQPQGVWEKAVWQAKCITNAISSLKPESLSAVKPKRLTDFKSPEIKRRFHRFLEQTLPDVVIVEYITLAYLVPEMRGTIRYFVDTHDVLSARNAAFQKRGVSHWIDLTSAEEAKALENFDEIIAIQKNEAEQFARLTNDTIPVVVAGHPAEPNTVKPRNDSQGVVFGILSSSNLANQQAIHWFMDEVWAKFAGKKEIELQLAGSICEVFSSADMLSNVKLVGRVNELVDFYQAVDVAINPIQFGTGLKIKSIEALAFGKPLVSTYHGTEGIAADETALPWMNCGDPQEWQLAITDLARSAEARFELSKRAAEFAGRNLPADKVYAELMRRIEAGE